MFARCLSSLQTERVSASNQLKGPATTKYTGDKKEFIEHIRKVMLGKMVKVKSVHDSSGSLGFKQNLEFQFATGTSSS